MKSGQWPLSLSPLGFEKRISRASFTPLCLVAIVDEQCEIIERPTVHDSKMGFRRVLDRAPDMQLVQFSTLLSSVSCLSVLPSRNKREAVDDCW